jgi:putative membrane protein
MNQLARLVVNAVALWVTVAVVPDLDWKDESNFVNILVLALVFGAINSYLKPVLKLLSLPIRLVTFGLFGLVLNAALFLLLAWVGEQFDLGFSIAGWPAGGFTLDVLVAAVIGAIVLSIVSTVLSFFVGRD